MLATFLMWMVLQGQTADSSSRFVETLNLVQLFGTSTAVDPQYDASVKVAIGKAIKDDVITAEELGTFMNRDRFAKLAGPDNRLDRQEVKVALHQMNPTWNKLHPQLKSHAQYLTTSFDMIDDSHREATGQLASWIAKNYRDDQPLSVIFVCTGNSRRSMLGASMGNLAAAYYGLDKLRFYSGGTAPSAFNSRTIKALREIGFRIDETGEEAVPGDPKTRNPKYLVKWGEALETIEFSKHYSDAANPSTGFAALMVCTEADGECPTVKGAAVRISMPFLDPKLFHDDPVEPRKYAERRDDIGRVMLSAVAQARAEMASKK